MIILDDFHPKNSQFIIQDFIALGVGDECKIKHYKHSLNKDYGSHKNYGIEHCHGDWIFQIDGVNFHPNLYLAKTYMC